MLKLEIRSQLAAAADPHANPTCSTFSNVGAIHIFHLLFMKIRTILFRLGNANPQTSDVGHRVGICVSGSDSQKNLCGIDWTIITKAIRKLTEMRTWMGNMGGCGVTVYYHERTYSQIMIMTVHCSIASRHYCPADQT